MKTSLQPSADGAVPNAPSTTGTSVSPAPFFCTRRLRSRSHLKPSEAAGSDPGVAPHTFGATLCALGSMHSGPFEGHGAAKQTEAAGSDLGAATQACGPSPCTPGQGSLCRCTRPSFEGESPTVLTP